MIDEIKLRKAVERAARAKAVLANETLTEAFAELEQDYIKAWRLTNATDVQEREIAWLAVRALGAIRARIETTVSDGAVASAELEAL